MQRETGNREGCCGHTIKAHANHPVSGFPLLFHLSASRQPLPPEMGRAAIAMAAVRRGTCDESGGISDRSKLRPPTDVMAITSLPIAHLQVAGGGIVNSALRSVLNAVLDSALRGQICHPPSAIDSALSGRFVAVHSPAVISSVCSWKSAWALSA